MGRSSAGAGSVILPGDCQTAAAGSCIEKDCKLLVLCGLLECLLQLHLQCTGKMLNLNPWIEATAAPSQMTPHSPASQPLAFQKLKKPSKRQLGNLNTCEQLHV